MQRETGQLPASIQSVKVTIKSYPIIKSYAFKTSEASFKKNWFADFFPFFLCLFEFSINFEFLVNFSKFNYWLLVQL